MAYRLVCKICSSLHNVSFSRAFGSKTEAVVAVPCPEELKSNQAPVKPKIPGISTGYQVCKPRTSPLQPGCLPVSESEAIIAKRQVEMQHLQPSTLPEYFKPSTDLKSVQVPKEQGGFGKYKHFHNANNFKPLRQPKMTNPFPDPVKVMPSHTVSDLEKAEQMLQDSRMGSKSNTAQGNVPFRNYSTLQQIGNNLLIQRRDYSKLLEKRNYSKYIEERNDSMLLEKRISSTLLEKRNYSTLLENRISSTLLEKRNDSKLLEKRNDSKLLEERNISTILEKRFFSTLLEKRISSMLLEKRNSSLLLHIRNNSLLFEKRNYSMLFERLHQSQSFEAAYSTFTRKGRNGNDNRNDRKCPKVKPPPCQDSGRRDPLKNDSKPEKTEAPFPSYSEYHHEPVELKPSECRVWEDKNPNFIPKKRGFHSKIDISMTLPSMCCAPLRKGECGEPMNINKEPCGWTKKKKKKKDHGCTGEAKKKNLTNLRKKPCDPPPCPESPCKPKKKKACGKKKKKKCDSSDHHIIEDIDLWFKRSGRLSAYNFSPLVQIRQDIYLNLAQTSLHRPILPRAQYNVFDAALIKSYEDLRSCLQKYKTHSAQSMVDVPKKNHIDYRIKCFKNEVFDVAKSLDIKSINIKFSNYSLNINIGKECKRKQKRGDPSALRWRERCRKRKKGRSEICPSNLLDRYKKKPPGPPKKKKKDDC